MDDETASRLSGEIDVAARIVERQWPEVVEAEDIGQEMWVHMLERPGSLAKLLEMTPGQRRNSLVMIGHQLASKERADFESFTGNIYYGTKEVHEILGRGALQSDKTKTDEERLDVEEGLELLRQRNTGYVQIVYTTFAEGEDTYRGSKDLTRAVDALARCMNNVHRNRRAQYSGGPGARTVVSNATARSISSHDYSGENLNWGKA